MFSLECNRPLNPIAPPTLVQTEGSDRAGVFSVNISGSVPSSPSLTTPGVVFLFEILDHTTSNYSYYWVVSLLVYLHAVLLQLLVGYNYSYYIFEIGITFNSNYA